MTKPPTRGKAERIPLTCAQCGTPFQRTRGRVGVNSSPAYCSAGCGYAARRTGRTIYCAWCDTPIYRAASENPTRQRQFCSTDCYAAQRGDRDGRWASPLPRHRVIAEEVLGRRLHRDEIVHFIDGNRRNFDPLNLAVFPSAVEHARCHAGQMSEAEVCSFTLMAMAAAVRRSIARARSTHHH